MGNFFGVRRRTPVVTAQDRAILQLKQQRDKIKIYQKKTAGDLVRNKELAIQLYQNGFRERALIALRRKKCIEDILTKTDKQLCTLEQMVQDIEFTQVEVSVVEGLKVGTEALKQLTNLMNIDQIQQMMDDSAEAAQKQKEIADILEQSAVRYDDEELIDELKTYSDLVEEKREREEEEKEVVVEAPVEGAEKPTIMPEIPTSIPNEVPITVEDPKQSIQAKLDELPAIPKVIPEEATELVEDSKTAKRERQLEPAQ